MKKIIAGMFALLILASGCTTRQAINLGVCRVTVNYDQTIDEMIKAGNYVYKEPIINSKNFSVKRSGQATIVMVIAHFVDREMYTSKVLQEFKKDDLRPATLAELLAFGAQYPEEQKKYPIVALGSPWEGWEGVNPVPFLWSVRNGERMLDSNDYSDLKWPDFYRFAAVYEYCE